MFTCAEIGFSHNGRMKLARELIRLAASAGFTGVKLQMIDSARLYENDELLKIHMRHELSPNQMSRLVRYAKKRGLEIGCTIDFPDQIRVFDQIGFDFLKICANTNTATATKIAMQSSVKALVDMRRFSVSRAIVPALPVLSPDIQDLKSIVKFSKQTKGRYGFSSNGKVRDELIRLRRLKQLPVYIEIVLAIGESYEAFKGLTADDARRYISAVGKIIEDRRQNND